MDKVIIEKDKPLSKSKLWQYQKKNFQNKGYMAWDREVPYYATNNLVLARGYANTIFRYLQEGLRGGYINGQEPIYIIEPGAGLGKLAFHLLSFLFRQFEEFSMDSSLIRYVMVDCCERNLTFWSEQPQLAPLFAQDILDYAFYDNNDTETLALLNSGVTLSKGGCNNPVIGITNYFFDSIPHDVFSFQEGEVNECLVQLSSPADNVTEDSIHSLQRVEVDFDFKPCSTDYYENEHLNKVLDYFSKHCSDSTLLIPKGAADCIDFLRGLSNDRLLLLSSDKGYGDEQSLENLAPPNMSFHGDSPGCFSLMVNYPAITQYVLSIGGDVCQPSSLQGLKIFLYSLGRPFAEMPETRYAYQQHLAYFSTQEYLALKNVVLDHADRLELKDLLATLRLSLWDPVILSSLTDELVEKIPDVSTVFRHELREGMAELEKHYYDLPMKQNILFDIARVFQSLECYETALKYYEMFLNNTEPDWSTQFNMGLCHYCLYDYVEAEYAFNRAEELNPDSYLVNEWLNIIRAAREPDNDLELLSTQAEVVH